MKLFLVEIHDRLDIASLDRLVAGCPALHIEIFDSLLALLSLPPEPEPHLVIVAEALAQPGAPLAMHCLAELRRRGSALAIGHTADLLQLCAALLDLAPPQPRAGDDDARPLPRAHTLSEREHEILMLLCDGLQNKQIARRLDLSVSTVKTHVANLFRKIGATNRLDAICKFNQSRTAERAATPLPPRRPAAWFDSRAFGRAA